MRRREFIRACRGAAAWRLRRGRKRSPLGRVSLHGPKSALALVLKRSSRPAGGGFAAPVQVEFVFEQRMAIRPGSSDG